MKHAALILAILLVLGGCRDDDSCPVCPKDGASVADPTISNIWPNEDLTTWTFSYTLRQQDTIGVTYYPTRDDIPAFGWDDVERMLASPDTSHVRSSVDAIYRMQFDSLIMTESGAVGQNLKEELYSQDGTRLLVSGLSPSRSFYARLCIARPDLREKIARIVGDEGPFAALASPTAPAGRRAGESSLFRRLDRSVVQTILGPRLIHGGAWEKTASWIGTYGVLDQRLAWKFLTSDLSQGAEFTYQLVPVLADDVFLHCLIHERLNEETEIGMFAKSLDCWYIVDFGIFEAKDSLGNLLGYFKQYDCGRVVYSPGIGPVYSFEADMIDAGEPTSAYLHKELSIIGTSTLRK
jgi:hypothetical protein